MEDDKNIEISENDIITEDIEEVYDDEYNEIDEELNEELWNEDVYDMFRNSYFGIKQYINDNFLNIAEYLSMDDLYDFAYENYDFFV